MGGDLRRIDVSPFLEDHVVSEHSFASFPPCRTMALKTFENTGERAWRDRGRCRALCRDHVRHWDDLFCSLTWRYRLLSRVTTEDVSRWLHHNVDGDNTEVFPKTWTVQDVFDSVTTVYSWFDVVRWAGLDYEDGTEGGREFFFFHPRKLPGNTADMGW